LVIAVCADPVDGTVVRGVGAGDEEPDGVAPTRSVVGVVATAPGVAVPIVPVDSTVVCPAGAAPFPDGGSLKRPPQAAAAKEIAIRAAARSSRPGLLGTS
jgi:hypothetical protein